MTATDKDFIVAIELGSSKISGIAGKKKDGTMQILAYAEEKTNACIKRGIAHNIEKTYQSINNIIAKLEGALKTKIAKAYVGIGGQSVRSYKCLVRRNLLTQSYITNEAIDSIRDESYIIPFPECEVIENFPQEYIVDQNSISDPVGVMGTNIECEYLNVIARTNLRSNIEMCFSNIDQVSIAGNAPLLAPCQLANNVLTDTEKRSGCVLVDLGAGTTTVVIYNKNILRHLVTIPLGSNNITQDLTTLQIDENEAEEIKLKYGAACDEESENGEEQESKSYTTSDGRNIEIGKIQNIIEARINEIIDNVRNQILNSNYYDKLLAGLVLTGGGSNMRRIDKAFLSRMTGIKIEKVRIAKTVNQPVVKTSTATNFTLDNAANNTLLALLFAGEEPCGGETVGSLTDMFDKQKQDDEKKAKLEAEEAERKAETAALATLEKIKGQIRENYEKTVKAKEELEKNESDKKTRIKAEEVAKTALDVLGEEYEECIEKLSGKDRHKQKLKEATELSTKLKDAAEELADAVKTATKNNSSWKKIMKTLTDLVNEN